MSTIVSGTNGLIQQKVKKKRLENWLRNLLPKLRLSKSKPICLSALQIRYMAHDPLERSPGTHTHTHTHTQKNTRQNKLGPGTNSPGETYWIFQPALPKAGWGFPPPPPPTDLLQKMASSNRNCPGKTVCNKTVCTAQFLRFAILLHRTNWKQTFSAMLIIGEGSRHSCTQCWQAMTKRSELFELGLRNK